jgi:hypothetical protein
MIILLLSFFIHFAQAQILVYNSEIYAGNGTDYNSLKVNTSGSNNAADEDEALIAYVPINPDTDTPAVGVPTTQAKNTIFTTALTTSRLPHIQTTTGTPFVSNPRLGLHIKNNSNVTKKIYVYYKSSSSSSTYNVVQGLASVGVNYFSVGAYSTYIIPVDIEKICPNTACSGVNFSSTSVTGFATEQQYLYVYPQDTTVVGEPATSFDPESVTGGLFIKLRFSSQIPTSTITFDSIDRGDTQLVLNYNGSSVTTANSEGIWKTLVLNNATGVNAGDDFSVSGSLPGQCPLDLVIATSNCYILNDRVALTGPLTVNNLTNGSNYIFSLAFVDKFKFTSKLALNHSNAPQNIEGFLKEQSCYLLSAGFQERHYVLDYFREFRDEVLSQFYIGRVFTNWYYETAPKYALYIYHSSVLSTIVRAFGYFMYFIMNYSYFFIFGFLILFFHRRIVRIWSWL